MATYPITIERKVTVDLTADDWQLFTASMDCAQAAKALNRAASEGLSLPTATEAFAHWSTIADLWARYGASDTEPRWVMRDLVMQVFGEEV
jgi:hypothetical protein